MNLRIGIFCRELITYKKREDENCKTLQTYELLERKTRDYKKKTMFKMADSESTACPTLRTLFAENENQ